MPTYELRYNSDTGRHEDEDGRPISEIQDENEYRTSVLYREGGNVEIIETEYREEEEEDEEESEGDGSTYTCSVCSETFDTERGRDTHEGLAHE